MQAVHPVKGSVERYIAQKTRAGWLVEFGRLNRAENEFLVAYQAVQIGTSTKFEVETFDPAKEETGWVLAAAKAIETAMRDVGETSRPYNIAVLPVQRQSLYVYLYPAQVNVGVYPLGGDVRYLISSVDGKITEKHQMHKSIIESVPIRSDMTVKVGYHTHVLSDLPEDTDVLLVLTREPRIPEIVVAGPHMFTINVNGKITVEDRPKPR